MNEYNQFVDLFLNALNNVEQEYFETQYNQFYALRDRLRTFGYYRGQRFIRHSERGFAYELYFQTRMLIERTRENQLFFPNYYLQGEIKKMNLFQVRGIFGYGDLGGNLIPDLLFHIPSQDANAFVIEIKAQPELEEIEMLYDLNKLSRFLNNYNYQKSIFLAVNISHEEVENMIRNNRENITNLFTEERLSDCRIIVKLNSYGGEIFNKTLQEIINE